MIEENAQVSQRETDVKQARRSGGFTLVEMMIVIGVLGILMAIALPNFSVWIAGERVRGAANDLYTGLMMARSEAMKRNVQVDVSRTSGALTDWSAGWSVRLAGGTVFQTQDASSTVTIAGPSSGTVSYAYTGRPVAASVDAEFIVSSTNYSSSVPNRYICISLSGMPNVKRCTCATSC